MFTICQLEHKGLLEWGIANFIFIFKPKILWLQIIVFLLYILKTLILPIGTKDLMEEVVPDGQI